MLLGVPMAHDEVRFNSDTIYGPLQMSHMLANWEQIHADIQLSKDRSRVVRPGWYARGALFAYQPAIVVQKIGNNN